MTSVVVCVATAAVASTLRFLCLRSAAPVLVFAVVEAAAAREGPASYGAGDSARLRFFDAAAEAGAPAFLTGETGATCVILSQSRPVVGEADSNGPPRPPFPFPCPSSSRAVQPARPAGSPQPPCASSPPPSWPSSSPCAPSSCAPSPRDRPRSEPATPSVQAEPAPCLQRPFPPSSCPCGEPSSAIRLRRRVRRLDQGQSCAWGLPAPSRSAWRE